MKESRQLALEIILCFVICLILTAVDVWCLRFSAPVPDIAWFCAVGSLVFLPLLMVRKIHPRDEKEAGLVFGLSLKNVLVGLAIVAGLLIPVAFGHYVFETQIQGAQFRLDFSALSLGATLYTCLIQVLCIALPEEFFYRGYMQTGFIQVLKQHPKCKKYAVPLAIVMTALFFAVSHLPSGNVTRLATFFPGLLFGFVRYKTDSLVPAILCHAGCNMMMVVLGVLYI